MKHNAFTEWHGQTGKAFGLVRHRIAKVLAEAGTHEIEILAVLELLENLEGSVRKDAKTLLVNTLKEVDEKSSKLPAKYRKTA